MKTTTKTILTFLTGVVSFASILHGSITLIDWGGPGMASSDTNFTLPTTPTDNGTTRTWEYSASTALVPTAVNYAGPTIYGALQTDNATDGPSNITNALVDDRTGTNDDRITTLHNSTTVGDLIRGLVFFQKSDFLNGSSDTLTFDATSSAIISVLGQNGAGGSNGTKLAVLDGTTWYVSNSTFGGFSGNLNISDLSIETFASYDPTGAPLDPTPSSFTTAGSTFTDIQAVGYYFNLGNASAGSAGMSITSIEITAIPEPSTFALLGLAGLAVVMFRRRK